MALQITPISYFQRIEGLCANVANQRRKDWSYMCVLRGDGNTYPQLSRQRGRMLNCSSEGALKSIPNIGGDPFRTTQLPGAGWAGDLLELTASPRGTSLSLPKLFCLPAERTSNVFDKAVGQQVQSIVSIATSSSVTSGSEGKSLKAAGTWLLACEEWCNYISLCGEVNREAFGGTGRGSGGRGLPQVTSGQDTVKIHQRHSQESQQPTCTMQALCHWRWSWVIGIWALEGFNKTLLFSLFFFSPFPCCCMN